MRRVTMSPLNEKLTKFGALIAIGSIALVGCSSSAPTPEKSTTSESSSDPETKSEPTKAASEATADSAAIYANEFLAAVINDRPTSSFDPPVKLTDDQIEELVLDGKVQGVSDAEIESLVDYFYENHPLGKFAYLDPAAPVQQRLQLISSLVLIQSLAGAANEQKEPQKLTADDVVLTEDGPNAVASFTKAGAETAPDLIFVDGAWKIDGKKLLETINSVPQDAGTTPAP